MGASSIQITLDIPAFPIMSDKFDLWPVPTYMIIRVDLTQEDGYPMHITMSMCVALINSSFIDLVYHFSNNYLYRNNSLYTIH